VSDTPARAGWARYLVPNTVTLGSIVIGWSAIVACVRGDARLAAWIGLWAVFTDRLDGLLARALEAQSEIGVQLDSLADLVSFGVAPAVVAFSTFRTGNWPWWSLAIFGGVHLSCAAFRLARFNVRAAEGARQDEYSGFPTTLVAAFLYTFLLSLPDLAKVGLGGLVSWAPLVLPITALAMIAPLRVPKLGPPKNRLLSVPLAAVVATALVLTALRRFPEYGVICTLYWLFFALVYHLRSRGR
jgi:CDP-diacylglycerol--serine O-phosphatidyltransferase